MAFRIVRNDITKMNTEAIVNTANDHATVGTGCDGAVYQAAGREELLAYRTEKVGFVPEGEVFLTPGFHLQAKYIIHAVSPHYTNGSAGEEEKLRSCYRGSLKLAKEKGIKSVAFPLISTGGFGYPKEEGMRIAVDEIHAFLLENDMEIYLVVFDEKSNALGKKIYPDLEEYIDQNYVDDKHRDEYGTSLGQARQVDEVCYSMAIGTVPIHEEVVDRKRGENDDRSHEENIEIKNGESDNRKRGENAERKHGESSKSDCQPSLFGSMFRRDIAKPRAQKKTSAKRMEEPMMAEAVCKEEAFLDFEGLHESKLQERMEHLSDTFSQYLMYLIQDKKMENAEVYKRAIVDKKIFSKIKNNADYHPQKLTALCLCIGAKLNLDESKDLLARAGYALSPCDKTDVIFSYFIENGIYDMIELDIQLEEHGLPCIIS